MSKFCEKCREYYFNTATKCYKCGNELIEIGSQKNGKYCDSCKAYVIDNNTKCHMCGGETFSDSSISLSKKNETKDDKFCTRCNKRLYYNVKICPNCGCGDFSEFPSELESIKEKLKSETTSSTVEITNLKIPFASMIALCFKWQWALVIASIPLFILVLLVSSCRASI
jgi:RNA polymerase subunit RPABC4/transcription elongation factor Spt4